jgi:nicotinamidase-related amidase
MSILLCLNLTPHWLAFVEERGKQATILNVRHCLFQARRRDWPVIHVHSERPTPPTAIPGLEPLASEPVFVKPRASAFSAPGLPECLRDLSFNSLALVGFTLARDCLASSVVAHELGIKAIVVRDAVGPAAPSRAMKAASFDATFAIVGMFAEIEFTASLFPEPPETARDWVQ